MTEPEQPRRRFLLPEPEPPRSRLSPRWLGAGAVAVVVAATVIAATHHEGIHKQQPKLVGATIAQLPSDVRRLPGETAPPGKEPVGVLRLADPTSVQVSRAAAIRDYTHITGAASESGRTVLTALVEVAYLDSGVVHRATEWVVSVWFHPGYTTSRFDWCVDHGFVDASTGQSDGHELLCPLPPGYLHPRPVT